MLDAYARYGVEEMSLAGFRLIKIYFGAGLVICGIVTILIDMLAH